ncbi:MAG: N-acetylmuramoyl-L-alanine amidase [Acidimicrobiales bacterium]
MHAERQRRRRRALALGVSASLVTLVASVLVTSGLAHVAGTTAAGTAPPTHRASLTAGNPAVPHLTSAVAGEPTSSHLMVATATDPATGGYWLVASDGGVFSFNAPFYGSAGALPLARPVVGAAATPDGGGYWLVASDGGVFSYGNAAFYGSEGGQPLNQPIVGMAATPTGHGYWLVASDGGIFTFGDAGFFGSTGSIRLNRPVVGMAATPTGDGYWLVASDGGIFTFGDAGFSGAATGLLQRSAVGMAAGAAGYRVLSSNGSVYDFGGAPFYGSAYVPPMVGEVVAIDPGHDGGNAGDPAFIDQPIDNGNGTESCDTVGTETATGYAEHAFNFDVGTRLETLLQSEGATVVMTRSSDTGVGPCVNVRAAIGNAAGADAAVSIHADGGPVSGRGFDVIEPGPVVSSISNNTAVVPASAQLAATIRNTFAADTGEPTSDYSGSDGIDQRTNLGGLNLTTVPKVLIECANMQNPVDAALTESPTWRQQAAQGLADGITAFLEAGEVP